MNITLNGTKITQDTRNLAFEKNNNVDEIVITVDTDESWSYKLDVKYPDKFNIGKDTLYNIIDLDRNGIICSVTLTREMLPFNGKYTMQLRGINGDKVYHSDTFEVWVKYSIEPGSTYNPVPSEFYQVEARLDNKVDEAKQYAENAKIASTRMPKISPDNTWLIWDAETGDYVDTGIVASGGTTDHSELINRGAANQHPMSAITGLQAALDGKQPTGDYLTEEMDPTVPEWAKQPQKPAYTAQEVGALPATTQIPSTAADVNAEPSGAVAQHNVSDVAHSDIRLIIQGLSDRLSAVADSDDATLDQLSEIVAYIKSNRDLISAITTNKVSVSDIVDNLTTNVANKPLSAAQGVALKALVDALTEAMPEAYTLPIASSTVLGGVQPVAKTDAMTQSVGVDAAGALWAVPGSGGGSGSFLGEYTVDEDVSEYRIFMDVEKYKRILISVRQQINSVPLKVGFAINGLAGGMQSEGGTSQITYFMFDVIRVSGGLNNGGLYSVYGNSRRSNNPDASTLLWTDIQYITDITNSIVVAAAKSDAVISAGSTIVVTATS